MDHDEIRKLVEFLKAVGNLKRTDRTGWVTWKSLNVEDPESVADHSWRTSLLSMIAADIKAASAVKGGTGIDAEKVVRMSVIHEIGEALIGDWDYYAKKKLGADAKERKEEEAVRKLLSLLPKEIEERYLSLFEDLTKNETAEAKLVNAADVLEMDVQAAEYAERGYDREKLHDFMDGRYTPKMGTLEEDVDLSGVLEFLRREIGFEKTSKEDRTKSSKKPD